MKDGGKRQERGPWTPMASAAQADPLRQVAEARARLALFWSAEAEGFGEMWANLSREERSKLVRSSSPHMPASPKDTVTAFSRACCVHVLLCITPGLLAGVCVRMWGRPEGQRDTIPRAGP